MQEETILLDELTAFDWDIKDSKSSALHSIHPYPAKFIPELPREILRQLHIPENSVVFDPFCGSGVTLTEAQKVGIPSIGVDLNPIACLISRVKTSLFDFELSNYAKKIVAGCQKGSKPVQIPAIKNLDHWFKKDVQKKVSILIEQINQVDHPELRDALNFCLSSNLVRLSNQDSDTRYAAVEKNVNGEDVFSLFLKTAEKLEKAKKSQKIKETSTVINKNSLLLDSSDFTQKIGLTITSPPYPNAYEYWLYHKYRMWWLGYDAEKVKIDEIGARPHYFKKNHQTADDFINQMEILFDFLYAKSENGAYSVFVIGRSKIHGEIVNNDVIIENAGIKSGFNHITTLKRAVKSSRKSFNLSHARIKEEFIVIHQKA
ncbi:MULTISPECIES: DNA methyltransferase [Flavobacteriaceae]|uniref:DNA methyltransferase n=1 Tax=Flavobacteriaceae TaxID=49546 RepID=UPI0023496907|nr:DNA methyltransferase [Muricauda sp. SP22]MDC6361653.1 DNA methyltransferase [Muricauda sp. SP22]